MAENIKTSARSLAAMRRQVAHSCDRCGTRFVGLETKRFCSTACRVAYSRDTRERERRVRLAAIEQLDRTSAEIMRGRVFADETADLLREAHEIQDRKLC